MSNKQMPYDEVELYKRLHGKNFKDELTNCKNFPCGEFECKHGNTWICAHLDRNKKDLTQPNNG